MRDEEGIDVGVCGGGEEEKEREDYELKVYDLTKIGYVAAWDGCIGMELWGLGIQRDAY